MLTIYKLQAQQVCGFGELFLSFGWNETECTGRQWRGPCVQGTVRVQEEFRQQCRQFIDIGERSLRRRVAGDGYTGKEAQNEDFGTSYTDFGARQYSPALRRWMTPDPLSEKYYGISPYAFCNNNPVNFVDPDGRIIGTLSGAVLGTISAGSQVLSTAAKGTVNGLFNGVDDIKSALPNASDEVVSEISERVLQSEQQALKSINKTQFIFEASAETIYFIQDEIEKDDE